MAIVAEGDQGRIFLPPTSLHEQIVRTATSEWQLGLNMPNDRRWFSPPIYGLLTYGDLFTPRQLVALTTFSVHGTIELDSARMGRDAGQIADEVISRLHGLIGAEVTVTL